MAANKKCRGCRRFKPSFEFGQDAQECYSCQQQHDQDFEDWQRQDAWQRATAIDPEWPAGENGYPALNP